MADRALTGEPEQSASKRSRENAYYERYVLIQVTCNMNAKGQTWNQGRIQRVAIGAIAPPRTTENNFIHHEFCQSENNIRDIRSFWRPLFCHSSVVKYTSCLLQYFVSLAVMRTDSQARTQGGGCRRCIPSPDLKRCWHDTWFH